MQSRARGIPTRWRRRCSRADEARAGGPAAGGGCRCEKAQQPAKGAARDPAKTAVQEPAATRRPGSSPGGEKQPDDDDMDISAKLDAIEKMLNDELAEHRRLSACPW